MTIYWQDGFDLYASTSDLGMNYITGGAGGIGTTSGRFGGGGFFTNSGGFGILRTFPTTTQEVWSSFALNLQNPTDNSDRIITSFGVGGGGGIHNGMEGSITYNAAGGTLKVWRGHLENLLATVSVAITSGWHWMDVRFKHSSTVGEVEIWMDEAQVSLITAQDTTKNTTSALTYASLGDGSDGVTLSLIVDDWLIYTPGSRLGDSRIETMVPTSDSSPNDGTPSTGSAHYAVVDEPQWNTSDYITMPNTSGDKEVYGHASISSAPTTVHAVKVLLVSQKSNAGSFQLEPLVISSGTEADGSAQNLQTTWGVQQSIFDVDPHTSAAWAYAAVNATTFGYKVP